MADSQRDRADPRQTWLRSRRQETQSARGQRLLVKLGRFNVSSLAATAVDFGVMITSVSLIGLSAVLGTVFGATSGAVTNFLLGRHWTFEAASAPPSGQAARYFVVSGASLGLNAAGEYLLSAHLGLQYIAARVIVAITVSMLWNFPMQRYFVFQPANPPETAG
jgi:putative flippase GtrA